MNSFPKLTVLISTYDDRDLVPKKLAEIQAQTIFNEVEFIFIETASPGKERELLEPFCLQHDNCHLITRNNRSGLYAAWNLGWENARAPWICVSNMDDAMHPRLLERVVQEISSQDCSVLSVLIAKQEGLEGADAFCLNRLKSLDLSMRPGPFFAWRGGLETEIGMFDDRYASMGDKDFWARVHHYKIKVGLICEVLYLYTKHEDQLSKSKAFEKLRSRDVDLAQSKDYPLVWSPGIQKKVKRIRHMRRIPVLGDLLTRKIYPTE